MELRFGIEVEVMLARAETFEPLWHDQLDFLELNSILEGIPTDDVLREGLRREGAHPSNLPYVVEGYDVPAPGDPGLAIGRLPKGLEIRTPVCRSIAEALDVYALLLARLREALEAVSLVPVHVSHHPRATSFRGPRNSSRTDWWHWQEAAMTTYGPDVNIGLDPAAFAALDHADLEAKLDYYSPAMVAFSLDAPLYGGRLWRGKSARTFHRSGYAPTFMVLPREDGRLEFKGFDTTSSLADLENDLLLFATVLLDAGLEGRATPAERVRGLRAAALEGWQAPGVKSRAAELLDAADRILPRHGLDPAPLGRYRRRLETEWLPADRTAALFVEARSVEGLLHRLVELSDAAVEPVEVASRAG